MYKDLLNEMDKHKSVWDLLQILREAGFVIESKPEQALSETETEEAWYEYDLGGVEAAVSYFEIVHGFIFGEGIKESFIGLKDWTQLVLSVKSLIKDNQGKKKSELKELVKKRFTYLDLFDVEKLVEQALEELEQK